jgi:cytochrome c oxidase subunit III
MITQAQTPPKSSEPAPVAEHFDDYAQQTDACLFGMWAFLMSEVMFFGGVFATYLVYRRWYPDAFAAASRELDVYWGTINTFVLLTSSLTMALAVRAAQQARRGPTALAILATMILGGAFLGIKFYEYAHKVHEHLAPLAGLPFHFEGAEQGAAQIFFGLYFGMTGLHALHMVIGIVLLANLLRQVFAAPEESALRVEVVGLYWHFVDLVWIFLFPILYLIDRSQ